MTMDFLATVAAYPKPDDKIRSTSLKVSSYSSFTFHEFICVLVLFTLINGGFSQVQGGGNVGNALTCLARLGLNPRLISKVPFFFIIFSRLDYYLLMVFDSDDII